MNRRRDRQPGLKMLARQLMPEDLDAPDAVVEANAKAVAAIEDARRVVGAAHTARQEADQAPAADAAAEFEAYRADKALPKPKAPALVEKADQAERRARVAQQIAAEAIGALHAARRANHDALVAMLEERLETARADALQAAADAEQEFQRLARAALFLGRVHARAEELDRKGLPAGGKDLPHLFSSLRNVAQDVARRATPWTMRILDAVGSGASWDDVAAQLGVERMDDEACAARDYLVNQERRLEWLNANGDPVRGGERLALASGRRLVPCTPPERPAQRARRERREREAAERQAAA